MKKDIADSTDISLLVNKFYTKVIDDPVIGFIFKETEGFSFEHHIPIIVSFWDSVLFGTMTYKGNPMIKHIELNKNIPLQAQHFTQWLLLWESVIREDYEGKIASEAISKAKNIAAIMQLKINGMQKSIEIIPK